MLDRYAAKTQERERVVVIGGGPGGYSAAFRAADLGLQPTLIERYPVLGGVCLNVGCIPSKALLHSAAVIRAAHALKDQGIVFEKPAIQPPALMQFKDAVITRLNDGLARLAEQRRIVVIHDSARFHSDHQLTLQKSQRSIHFDHAIIATGSRNRYLDDLKSDVPLMYSSDSLNIKDIPQHLLIVGGGVIGIESAFIYQGLGSRVTIVEVQRQLLEMCDADISKPLLARLAELCETIYLQAQVVKLERHGQEIVAEISTPEGTRVAQFNAVLVAAGRVPNSDQLGLETLALRRDDNGFIATDECMRTQLPHIYAVGDVTGEPMLAHKASQQGKIAAEHAAGMRVAFDDRAVPSVIYSDPELAWVGLNEQQARTAGIDYQCAVLPWQANGRALGSAQGAGLTKLLYQRESKKLLGGAVCGANADTLIAEIGLALAMDSDLHDLALSIPPHPTYAETLAQTAERALGTITDLYAGKAHY